MNNTNAEVELKLPVIPDIELTATKKIGRAHV